MNYRAPMNFPPTPLAFGRPAGAVIQYAYTVADIHASIRRYVDLFRVGPWFVRGPFTPPLARYRDQPAQMTITLARAFAGDTMIELIQQHDDGPSVYREMIERRGHGFHHFAIGTLHLEQDLDRFAAMNYPVAFEDRVPSGARVVYVDSTADLPGFIEIIEMNDAMQQMYTMFHDEALTWDGTDPIRLG
jgi:Glyoxalase/Bleomycin resistance protein/Dioxygenase superfamily